MPSFEDFVAPSSSHYTIGIQTTSCSTKDHSTQYKNLATRTFGTQTFPCMADAQTQTDADCSEKNTQTEFENHDLDLYDVCMGDSVNVEGTVNVLF